MQSFLRSFDPAILRTEFGLVGSDYATVEKKYPISSDCTYCTSWKVKICNALGVAVSCMHLWLAPARVPSLKDVISCQKWQMGVAVWYGWVGVTNIERRYCSIMFGAVQSPPSVLIVVFLNTASFVSWCCYWQQSHRTIGSMTL